MLDEIGDTALRHTGPAVTVTGMTTIERMLDTYPKSLGDVDRGALTECVAACLECSQACTACADACLSEDGVAELTTCIRANLDCADACTTTMAVLSRHTGYDANITRAVLDACRQACGSCGDQCTKHGERHEHCAVCAQACRRCEEACAKLLNVL